MKSTFKRKNIFLHITRLISMIYRYNHIYMNEQLEDINLHSGQYTYLIYLYHHDGQRQDDIAKTLKLNKAGTTRALKKLEKAGYIFRKPDEKDRRSNLVFLTEKAWQIQPMLVNFYSNWINLALEGFSNEDLNTLHNLLNRMAINALSTKGDTENERKSIGIKK